MVDNVHGMGLQRAVYVLMVMVEHSVKFFQVDFFLWNVHKLKTKCYYIVPCASAPCENGGTCQLLATNTYGCVCTDEFTGARCETPILSTVIVLTM